MTNFTFKKIDAPGPAGTYAYISADGVDLAGEAVGNYGNVDGDGDGTFHGLTAQAGGSFTTFDPLGSTNTNVEGITSSGEIFGDYVDNLNRQYGFVDSSGVATKISVFLANSTTVNGVNDGGVIYGEFADNTNGVHGFVDNSGTFSQIDVPGATSTSVSGVNAAGVIVGTFTDAALAVHGFIESNGSFKTIDPPGSIFTSVVGVSDAGLVVGNYQDSANNQHSFVDNNGVFTTISIPGATSTSITATDAAGEIVGNYSDSSGNVHGFIDQNGVITTVDVPGATETNILGISASGEITGYYNDSSFTQHGFVGMPVPVVIEADGTTSLVQVGNNYFLDPVGGGTGPELQDGGVPKVAGQEGTWAPIAAEQTSTGYEVAWKNSTADQYTIWATDSSGNFSSFLAANVSGTSAALESLETSFHQDLNGDGVIGPVTAVIEADGTTSLVQVGSNYFLDPVGGGTGPELQDGGVPKVAGQEGTWAPIAAEQTSTGYDVAWKNSAADQYTVWATDSSGNFSSFLAASVSGTSAALETLETSFHQDLNGDGVIGLAPKVLEADGTTSLVELGNNYFLDPVGGGTGPELQDGGVPKVAGQEGTWAPIAAEQTSTGYEVAWKNSAADQYTVWATDSSGNFSSFLASNISGSSAALEALETSFHQDLNGDGIIGPVTPVPTVIEADGTTSLVQIGGNYFLDPVGGGTGPELQDGGVPKVAGQEGTWAPIAAEQTSTGYEVAWKNSAADQYTVWATDSSGNFSSFLAASVSGTSAALEALETSFHQDLNGDGTIGIPITLIQTDGSTSLTQVGSNYFLYAVGGTSGPELYYSGAPVVAGAGQFSGWAPIGAVHTSSGYDVAWKMSGADQYAVWTTDSNGIFTGSTGAVAGASIALEAYEPTFQQDLNGDGTLGVVTTVIETAGSTTLEEVGNNFYLLSGGSIPTLKVDGTSYVVDDRGSFTPIGAEEITTPVNDTYDVALKVAGADQYVVWSVDSDGNYISALTGTVSGNSATLESFEPIFQQDLNGDGSIGVVTTVIEAAGSTALTEVANNFYFYSGGVGPEFKLNGTPYVVGASADWTPIGAEQVSGGGYDVALKVAGADQYTVWSTDSNGNYVSALFGTVSGSSTALESVESVFHQDLNGDGVIGASATIATGATLELTAADSVSVQFNGPTGTLILDHAVAFAGQISGLTGTGSPSSSDQIDLKDISFGAGTTVAYTGTSTGGMLTVSDAQDHTANIALVGNYTGSTFTLSGDGSGGTIVIDPPVKQDTASGTLSFNDTDSTDIHTVAVTAQNDDVGYVGNFTADAITAANGQDSVGWHFNFDSSPPAKTVSQSYDVTVTDHHADGTNSAATQPVTVTIAGPGNDAFVFHPGVGADVIVNAASSDTIELDGFSSVTGSHQLASLLAEAQAGQPQSLFQSANGGHDTLINLGNHDSITLTNVHIADLHASNFIVH